MRYRDFVSMSLTLLCAFCALLTTTFAVRSDEEWGNFKVQFGKKFSRMGEEEYRRAIWDDNMDFIEQHNDEARAGKHSYTVGVNEFADWTQDEFVKTMNGAKMSVNASEIKHVGEFEEALFVYPSVEVDWRKKGYVTPVKNQEQCGSCWAFSTTGALEGQHFKVKGQLVSLSEQNLVDCTRKYGNKGCGGGFPYKAMDYIARNGGIDTEESYPYEAKDDECRFNPDNVGATDRGYKRVARGSEYFLQRAVTEVGPVSVCIDASHRSFRFYRQGVYYEPGCSSWHLDHAVLVVGFGTDQSYDKKDYWIVKNSWSTNWGEEGYVRMSRNKRNQCGIATEAVYPVV